MVTSSASGVLSLTDTVNGLVGAVKNKGVAGLIKLLNSLENAKQPELTQSLKERGRGVLDELKSLHLLSFFSTVDEGCML